MKVMVMVKATVSSEAGIMPGEALLSAMDRFNAELIKAGVMLAGFWLWQVKSIEEAIEWLRRCPNPHAAVQRGSALERAAHTVTVPCLGSGWRPRPHPG